jgi:GrpB-like predicted nucleotidyltransferase (UPF0157 family)
MLFGAKIISFYLCGMKNKPSPDQAGIIPHAVEIVPYNDNWPAMAAAIAATLFSTLQDNLLTVEHIGSTSIPGLGAKPVIDLIPIVHDIQTLDNQKKLITDLGYSWHGEFGIQGRRLCGLTDAAGKRVAHLHFFQKDAVNIERHLAFRDFMKAHPDIAKQYEQEKRRAAALHPYDSLAYNDEKAAWVQHYEKEALAWYERYRRQVSSASIHEKGKRTCR